MTTDSIFASRRERRLWVWALAVAVAIYATVGLTRPVSGALRERGLLEISFVAGMLLVVATVATLGLRTRPGAAQIAVALGIAAAYLLVLVRIEIPEERSHLIEYGVLAVFVHEALRERARRGRRVRAPAVVAVVVTALLGVLDEGIQALLPSRVFDVRDMGFNAGAAVMAVGASLMLGRARRWRRG